MNIEEMAQLLGLVPQVLQAILPLVQTGIEEANMRRARKRKEVIIFKHMLNALYDYESTLLIELIKKGKVTKTFNDFNLEDPSTCSHIFNKLINKKWEYKFSCEEEILASQLPIQVNQEINQKGLNYSIDSYTFIILPEIQKLWKNLYKHLYHS